MPAILQSLLLPILLGLMAGLLAVPAKSAEPAHRICLSKTEQHAAVAGHRAISLGKALASARRHRKRAEVLRARLCRRGNGLVYVLTLLSHNGKVTRVAIDAANGVLIKTRR